MPRITSLRPLPWLLAAFALLACDASRSTGEPAADPTPEPEVVARHVEPLPGDLEARVVTYLEQYGRHWPTFRFHGTVLVARGDQVAMHRAFGFSDLVMGLTNEPSTAFRIGTLSAQLTAVATLRLVEAGVLRLDDPVSRHLPEWPGGEAITLEQLLSHRSGIPNFTEDEAFEAWKHAPHTLQSTLELFRERPRDPEAGQETSPSNSNYVLLGAVLEAAAGKPYEQVVTEQVLEPLAMEQTRYATSEVPQAIGMTYNEEDYLEVVRGVHPSAFGPAGGWISTADDLLRLYRALAGETLLSRRSVVQMHGVAGEGLGYGWAPSETSGQSVVSWPGLIDGFNSAVLYVPADDTTILVLSNSEVVPTGTLVEDIAKLIYEGELSRRDEPQAVPVPLEEQLPAIGRYVPTRGTEEAMAAADADTEVISEVYVRQVGEHLVFHVPTYGAKRMHPLGGGRYFFMDGAQTRAQVIVRADQSALLVLEAPGGELRFTRVAEPAR